MIETRKTEIRYVTSDPKKMLNMYVCKTCPQNMGGVFH
jgi:hypothetical protein